MTVQQDKLDLYRDFVRERHVVWERRQAGEEGPWTDDYVLRAYKFCNDFRILDAGSQYLFGTLLSEPGVSRDDQLFRAFLYRYNNYPDPWEVFHMIYGRFPVIDDLETGLLSQTWETFWASGGTVFTPAYQITSGRENGKVNKVTWAVGLAAQGFTPDGGPRTMEGHDWAWDGSNYILPELREATDAREVFGILTRLPRCASFMGQQIMTDYSYLDWTVYDDSGYVVPGPGARRGAKILAPDAKPEATMEWLHDNWSWIWPEPPELGLPDSGIHRMSLMDVQNTLCEFQKYDRRWLAGPNQRTYKPHHRAAGVEPVLPAKWMGR